MEASLSERVPTPATVEDLPEVLMLVAAMGLPIEGISAAFPRDYAVVREGAELFGVAGLETYGDLGLLRSVAVAEDQRNQGIGGALVRERLHAARQQRIRCVYLLTLTAADYFRALGFSDVERAQAPAQIQRSREFATICPASAACLALRL